MTETSDRVLRAMTDDGAFRVMTIRSTRTVREAIAAQDVRGIVATQLGELITAAVLVRETMAPPNRVQVLLRDKSGNLVTGDAFPAGRTRGLVRVDDDVLGVRLSDGGYLQVMRSMPGGAPHQGVVDLPPELEVGEALVNYFQRSEQIETRADIACVLDGDRVIAAGGYVVQLLPEVTEPPLEAMDERLAAFGALGPQLVDTGADPQRLLDALLAGTEYTALASSDVCFACACNDGKATGAVAALGAEELRELLASGETITVRCDYCRTQYTAGPEDFRRILGESD